jgi:long-chain acyl-CoA synthetase
MPERLDEGIVSGDRFLPRDELFARAARATTGFASLGIGAGDAVGLLLRNDLAFFEATLAAGALGAYTVPVNWHFRADEILHVLDDAAVRALVVHADLLPEIDGRLPAGVPVLTVATPPEVAAAYRIDAAALAVPEGAVDWDAWVDAHEPWDRPRERAPASMIYTSGTTGRPKGVRRGPLGDAELTAQRTINEDVLGLVPGMRTVVPAPLYHSAPNTYALTAARNRGLVVLQPRFDPAELLALVERHSIDRLQMVPTMFVRLLQLPDEVRARHDTSSLVHVVHAAAPCPVEVKRAMIGWWGPVIVEYYGCTEAGAITSCTSEEWLRHPGSVGRPIGDARLRILRSDGTEAATGEPGEVYVRQPAWGDFTYQGRDDERREIELDGLITCGDVGFVDDDGFLFLCDRRTDMVISGGVNIYPAEIEAVVHELASVRDCAVFGIPDAEYGEALCAVVEADPDTPPTAEEIRDHVRRRLAAYKVPRVVELVDRLPREDSGKIFKRKLREPYWQGTGRSI